VEIYAGHAVNGDGHRRSDLGSALPVTDAGAHAAFLLAEFASSLARFLDTHSLSPCGGPDAVAGGGQWPAAVTHRKGCKMSRGRFQASPACVACMIVFFPTYASRTPTGWSASVAGMVAVPLPERSRRRVLAVAVLRRLLDLDDAQMESEIFRRRAEVFLFRRVAGQRIRIALGDRIIDAGLSDRSGHFQARVDFDDNFAAAWSRLQATGQLLDYTATSVDADGGDEVVATSSGVIHLVPAEGTSVISDIDDTVKFTNVADRRELLRNTLVREFIPVEGMPELYQRWQHSGAIFHYVSSSPWQLSDCLCRFLGAVGLPAGSMHLKLFRLKDSTPLGRLPSRKRGKRRTIERIMDDFPARRFVLVGDSGERDPEVYASVARRRPEQVAGIIIREVPAKASRAKVHERLDKLARRLPSGGITIFQTPDELTEVQP
jgi:phosphatidate phosphatase APP1